MTKPKTAASSLQSIVENLFEESVIKYELPNGLTVIAKQNSSAEIISAQVWVKTGSIHEGKFLGCGISHYLEHMLFKGTTKRSAKEINQTISSIGGSSNAYTTFDRTVYYINAPNTGLETTLDVLSDMVFNSILDPKDAASERDVILREIDMGADDPHNTLSENLFKTAFHHHPYRHPIIGHKALFESITPADLLEYYQSRYSPSNCVLIVVGNFDPDKLKQSIEHHFGQHPMRRLHTPVIETEPTQLAKRSFYQSGDYNIVRGSILFKVPGITHQDAPGLRILASALGDGTSSILWQKLREEKQIVHSIDASLWNPGSTGLIWISYACDPKKREIVEKQILATCHQAFTTGFKKAVIDKAIRHAMISEINSRKTMNGQAAQLGAAEVIFGGSDCAKHLLATLQKVKAADLARLGKKYLIESQATFGALEPTSSTEKKTAQKKLNSLPEFESIKLKNGARILLQPSSTIPKVHITLLSQAGSLYEGKNEKGISTLLATLLTKDTKKKSAKTIAETIDKLGISFSEIAGNNTIGLKIEFLEQDLSVASQILKEAILEPKFLKRTLDIEREGQIASIEMALDEVTSFADIKLRELYFKDYPLATDCYGTIPSLKKIKLEDIQRHYQKIITPTNLVVSVTGNFDKKQILSSLKWLETLPKSTFKKNKTAFTGPTPNTVFEKKNTQQAIVMVAFGDTPVNSEDFIIGEFLSSLLNNMSGNLYQTIREELGLAYFVGTSRLIGTQAGMFSFYAGTHPDHVNTVLKEINNEVQRLKSGKLSAEEITRTKTQLKAHKKMGLQKLGARSMEAALNGIYDEDINKWHHFDALVDAVTPEQLTHFANTHFTEDKKLTLVVGP